MIPESGKRFLDTIMLDQKFRLESDSTQLNQTLAVLLLESLEAFGADPGEAGLLDANERIVD